MKSFLLALILVSAIADPYQDCVKEKCPDDYNACTTNFGCATAALKCQKKCGNEDPCFGDCAKESGNPKLVTLYECGKKYCRNGAEPCQFDACVKSINSQCSKEGEQYQVNCIENFFRVNTHCQCIRE